LKARPAAFSSLASSRVGAQAGDGWWGQMRSSPPPLALGGLLLGDLPVPFFDRAPERPSALAALPEGRLASAGGDGTLPVFVADPPVYWRECRQGGTDRCRLCGRYGPLIGDPSLGAVRVARAVEFGDG
jgi:hypothetical protein